MHKLNFNSPEERLKAANTALYHILTPHRFLISQWYLNAKNFKTLGKVIYTELEYLMGKDYELKPNLVELIRSTANFEKVSMAIIKLPF